MAYMVVELLTIAAVRELEDVTACRIISDIAE